MKFSTPELFHTSNYYSDSDSSVSLVTSAKHISLSDYQADKPPATTGFFGATPMCDQSNKEGQTIDAKYKA